jgi:hypothetical protein
MNQRVLNGLAIAVVGLVAVGAIVVMAIERLKPPVVAEESQKRKHVPNPISNAEHEVLANAGSDEQAQTNVEAKSDAPAPQVAKVYTWAEVEQALESIRQQRGKSPTAWAELEAWYDRLSHFSFSQSTDYPEHIKKLEQWKTENPESPTPLVVLGRTYLRYAWDARGGGFADSVSDVGWELYRQRIVEAQRLLEESLRLGVNDADVYARLVEVAKSGNMPRERADNWVEESLKVDPTYYPTYEAMAEYLLPRWHGEPGDIERFAADLAQRIPGEDGLVAFGMVARRAQQYQDLLFQGEFDRTLLGKSAVALVERYPQAPRIVNFAARATVAAQDHAAAQRIRPLVGEYDAEHRVWPGKRSHEHFMRWAAATNIPSGEKTWILSPKPQCGGLAFAPNDRYLWYVDWTGQIPARLFDLETGRIRE